MQCKREIGLFDYVHPIWKLIAMFHTGVEIYVAWLLHAVENCKNV